MKPDRVYLSHIRDAIAKIERYLAGVDYETFTGNDMMIDSWRQAITQVRLVTCHFSAARLDNPK